MAFWLTGYEGQRDRGGKWTSVLQAWDTVRLSWWNLIWEKGVMISVWERCPTGGWSYGFGAPEGDQEQKGERWGWEHEQWEKRKQSEQQLVRNYAGHVFAHFSLTTLWRKSEKTYSEKLSNILRFPQLNKWWNQDLNSGLSDSFIQAIK